MRTTLKGLGTMNTKEMMEIALNLAGLDYLPEDSSILVESDDVSRVLAGIDMSGPELLTAKMLGFDCVARHHPQGPSSINLGLLEARDHQEIMVRAGVPINKAQKIAKTRKTEMDRIGHSRNLMAPQQLAELLEIASLCVHTPSDLIVEKELQKRMGKLSERLDRVRLEDIVTDLKQVREFSGYEQGPRIYVGDEKSYAGRIYVIMSGGGACNLEEYKAMIDVGVGTFIVMHMKEQIVDSLKSDDRCNVVVTGHMGSDSYGFNRILDAWEARGLEIKRIGGIV